MNLTTKEKELMVCDNGHPHSHMHLRHLDVIGDSVAGFVYTRALKASFEEHLFSCVLCANIHNVCMESYAKTKTMQAIKPITRTN